MGNDRLTDLGSSGAGGYDAALLDHWLAGRTPGGGHPATAWIAAEPLAAQPLVGHPVIAA